MNSTTNGSTFTMYKRGFGIDDVIFIVSGLLMSVITIIMTIRSVKYILLSLPIVITFVYILLDILRRCYDRKSFINFSERGITCLDIIKHYNFSYEWREIISVKLSEIRSARTTSYHLTIYTKDSFFKFQISSFDVSILTLEKQLENFVPEHLLEFEKT